MKHTNDSKINFKKLHVFYHNLRRKKVMFYGEKIIVFFFYHYNLNQFPV